MNLNYIAGTGATAILNYAWETYHTDHNYEQYAWFTDRLNEIEAKQHILETENSRYELENDALANTLRTVANLAEETIDVLASSKTTKKERQAVELLVELIKEINEVV